VLDGVFSIETESMDEEDRVREMEREEDAAYPAEHIKADRASDSSIVTYASTKNSISSGRSIIQHDSHNSLSSHVSDNRAITCTSFTRNSHSSGRSITQRKSHDSRTAASLKERKDSWSTQSSRTSRRSMESTRMGRDGGELITPPMRRSISITGDRKGVKGSRLMGREEIDMMRRGSVEE
jgi:hypothetical protein